MAGVSPGAVLVFMLAGPASNIAAVGMVHKELGRRALVAYLGTVSTISVAAGLLLDQLVSLFNWEISGGQAHQHSMLPEWLAGAALVVLAVAAIKPLRQQTFDRWLNA